MKDFTSQENFIDQLNNKVNSTRSSLVGEKFNIISMMGEVKYEVEVKKLIGLGGSSLVYEVAVDDTYPPIKKMIMKEFYPNYNEDNIVAERNPINRLELYFDAITSKDEQRIKKDRNKFIDAYNKHIRILEMDSFFDSKIVRPYRVEIDNSFLYSLYEVDSATSVDKYYNLDLARIVDILIQTADILIHLHKNDIIYMDLKPANILYDYNNSKVKLFDFDAAIDLNELEYINEFSMPSERAFIPPEIRYITNIGKRKEFFITEEIDTYMLGATFFTLIMGRYPTNLENEDMEFLARNVRDELSNKSNKILVNKYAVEEIIELLQETLPIRRYISVEEFKNRLIKIENNLRFRNNEDFSNILSAVYFLDYNRLYNYIIEKDDLKSIDVAIVGNNDLSRIFFSFIFSTVIIKDVDLNINLYDKNPKKFYKQMLNENPLLAQSTEIKLNGRIVNNNINTDITDKPYAYINFKSYKERIEESYILILDDTGYDYSRMGDVLYEEFRLDNQKRVILNYSRNNHRVDIRQEKNISYYNFDLASTSTFKNRKFNDKLLEEAFDIYRLHVIVNKGERVDYDDIWKEFLEENFYNLKTSLRVVLSMEYYLFMAGIEDDDQAPLNFYKMLLRAKNNTDEINIRDILADSEHHSWNRFMISQGYRIPTTAELNSYAYVDQKGYADYQNKFHPLITNSNAGLRKKGYIDKLTEVSNHIDKLIVEKTIYKEDQVKFRLLNVLNNTLRDDNDFLRRLRPLWIKFVNLSYKIIENELYANNSLNVLTYEIEEILYEASPDLKTLSNDYIQIKSDLDLIIRRNKELDIKLIDYMIIDSIPLISSEKIKTIYKPFIDDDENLWANIIATIKFYPEKLIFLSDKPVDSKKIDRIESFLKNKRLQKYIYIEVITYDQLQYYNKENSVVDLTLNSHLDGKRPELMDIDYIEYIGSNNWFGNYKALEFYSMKSSLTVEETFFLNNAMVYESPSISNITRLIKHYPRLWQAYINMDSNDWQNFVEAIKYSRNLCILNLDKFEREDEHSLLEVGDFKFRRYDTKKYKSLKHLLDELIKEDILIEYEFPANPGYLRLHSYNDDLSRNLGEFISKNMWEYNEGFDLVKTQLLEKNYEYSYLIVSNKLNFQYKYKVDNPKEFANRVNKIMLDIDKSDDGNSIRIFNKIENSPYVKSGDDFVLFRYEYGDLSFREFFNGYEDKGSMLRVYTYFELIKYADFFDEIKIRVNLRWKAYDDYREDSKAIENILDIVCTKGFSTIIISTVENNINNEDLYEINNHTKQFGMDAKPVLISSNSNDDTSHIKMLASAAGVYFIDRDMIKNNGVGKYIKNIASGKKNWQDI